MINTPASLTIITKQSLPCQVTLTLLTLHTHFWATVCKTVRPMPSDRRLCVCLSVCLSCLSSVHSCLSVCNVAVLWPNSWMDQDETWHAGRPRPGHIVLWGPSTPSPRFSAQIRCGQMTGWIKMPLGIEDDLGPGDFALDGDPCSCPSQKGSGAPPIFGPCLLWPNGWMDQDGTWHGDGP